MLSVKSGLRLNPFVSWLNWPSSVTYCRLNMHSTWFKEAIIPPEGDPPSSSVLRISIHLLNVSTHFIGFCIHTRVHSISTLQHSKGTKTCTVHFPVLELGPSKIYSPLSSPLHYNNKHAQPNIVLFFIYFSIRSQLNV